MRVRKGLAGDPAHHGADPLHHTLPNGEQLYPSFQDLLVDFAMVQKFQIRCQERDGIEVRLVVTRQLTAQEVAAFDREMHTRFNYPFRVDISYHDELARCPSGKFHDFRDVYSERSGNGG